MSFVITTIMCAVLRVCGPEVLEAVDVYGVRSIEEASIRSAVGLKAGDPTPGSVGPIIRRVAEVSGVAEVDVSIVCCSQGGGSLLYVGIREVGMPEVEFRNPPTGSTRLPDSVLALGARFRVALQDAVQRGATAEDVSEGYALSVDPQLRSVQQDFRRLADVRHEFLTAVLRNSADSAHRALAAQIVAYGSDKEKVVGELVDAVTDPAEEVRNNAIRALAVLAQWSNENPDARLAIPGDAIVPFLNSHLWTDRNKAVFLLMPLTATLNPVLLDEIRRAAVPSLVEMARWSNPGHALGAYFLLARVVGVPDSEAFDAWSTGEREKIIVRTEALRSPR